MNKTVYIAEKPELGRSIAEAIGGYQSNQKGYIKLENNVYITWAFGHLFQLKEPQEYNEKYKAWRLEDLPLEIEEHQLKPINDKKDQIKIIKALLKDAKEVVHAGDPDEEGQLLIDEILEYFNYKGEVKRILINDNTKKAVQKALQNLQNNKKFKGLRDSAYFRSICDYEYGMNLTRAYSVNNHLLSVGRVQTPILNLIYLREIEVKNHIKQKYYILFSDKNFKYQVPKDFLENNLCVDEEYLNQIKIESENNNNFKISDVQKIKLKEYSPLAYNLLELQADGFRKYNYSPDIVKNISQALREKHKAITYNRSDCQYLSSEHYEERKEVINTILKNLWSLEEYKNILSTLNLDHKHTVFNDEYITAHHGIIPTNNEVNISSFSTDERNIYLMIINRYLMLFSPPKLTEKYVYTATNSSNLKYIFTQLNIVDQGYTSFLSSNKQKEKETIKIYEKGAVCSFATFEIAKYETKPKQLYTYASLLKTLTSVHKYTTSKDLQKALLQKDKEKKGENGGIGTPATRDTIIKLLILRDYVREEKNKLITTEKGRNFLNKLPDLAKTPDITAEWSLIQENIKKGVISIPEAVSTVKETIRKEIERVKTSMQSTNSNYSVTCPLCKTGYLQQKPGKYGYFWGCSNFGRKPEPCKAIFKDLNNKPLFKK